MPIAPLNTSLKIVKIIVNDDLNNYYINNNRLYNKITGENWEIDYSQYVNELDKALDITWYELKEESFKITKKFNAETLM